MTRKDMEELRAIRHEVEALKRAILEMPMSEDVGDTYGDYHTGQKRVKLLFGRSTKKYNRLAKKLSDKSERLVKMAMELERYLDDIDDPKVRTILRSYYSEGRTQEEIGSMTGYSRQGIGRIIERFWEEE